MAQRRRGGFSLGLAGVAVAGWFAVGAPAVAQQDVTTDELAQEVQNLQEQVAGLTELVEEELAAREDIPQNAVADLQVRVNELQSSMRSLTGEFETVEHRLGRLRQRLDTLIEDVELRFQNLEDSLATTEEELAALQDADVADASEVDPEAERERAQEAAPTGGAEPPAEEATELSEDAIAGLEDGAAEGQAAAAGDGDGTDSGGATTADSGGSASVGGASSDTSGNGAEGGDAAAGEADDRAGDLPVDDPDSLYDAAFERLQQERYGEAEQAFSTFLERYPEHDLADNALYWRGETFYVRREFNSAAVAFAEGYEEYPGGSKAPDNLLKLGMSLAALDRVQDACIAFAELPEQYPEAPENILNRAEREAERNDCADVGTSGGDGSGSESGDSGDSGGGESGSNGDGA